MTPIAIRLGLVLIQAAVLHLFMKCTKRRRYEKHFILSILCAGAITLLHSMVFGKIQPFISTPEPGPMTGTVSMGLLFLCAFPMIRYILSPGFLLTPLTALVLVGATYGLQGITEPYMGPIMVSADQANPGSDQATTGSTTNSLDPVNIVKNGLDSLNALKEDKSLTSDFKRGMELFKERKEWMDSLTPEEKASYRADMRQFLEEQGLAEDPYSLANIRSANPTNLTAMASLFDHLEDMDAGTVAERSRKISSSLQNLTSSLQGIHLSPEDMANMKTVSELLAANDSAGAMAEIKKQLKASNGKNQLAGTMMAALMQSKSGIPADMIVSDKDDKKTFDFSDWLPFGKKKKEQPADEASTAEPDETKAPPVQTSLADTSIEDVGFAGSTDDYVPVSAELGIVHVPADQMSLGDWVTTVQLLSVSGYASLGGETAILLEDGTIYHNGDIWQLDNNGYRYRFSVDKVVKGRVHLTGLDRTTLAM